jgi:hypothetical protein
MDRNAYRDDNGTDPDEPDTYWRRRAATLAAGLSLLGLLAWAFSGGGQPAGPAPRNSPASGALSAAQLHLVVMSAGRVIWDSADCARGGGTQLGRLSRGVPVQEYFTWNRAITLPGCVTLASSARPGSYAAQARTPAVSSGLYSFRLAR